MAAWRSAPRNWKPRLPAGSARPRRRMAKRTSCMAATRAAMRCRIGADKQRRAAKIRQAKAELEAEAKAAAEAKLKEQAAADEKQEGAGGRKGGRKGAPP